MTDALAFRGFRFPAEVILWVRWYLQFPGDPAEWANRLRRETLARAATSTLRRCVLFRLSAQGKAAGRGSSPGREKSGGKGARFLLVDCCDPGRKSSDTNFAPGA
jgi:hypothetical protein